MSWFATPTDIANDPRWSVVAIELGCSPRDAFNVWFLLMAHANKARPRGSVRDFDPSDLCTLWRMDLALVLRILDVFRARRWVDDDDRFVEWAKTQPNKGDKTATERKRRQRAKQRATGGSHARDSRDSGPPDAGHAVTTVTGHGVTALHTYTQESEELRSVGSSSQPDTTSLSHTSRADAREAGGGFMAALKRRLAGA